MYSIVEIKGKQYRVEPEQSVRVDHIDLEPGTVFNEIKVLFHNDSGKVQIGQPYLDKIKVVAKVEKYVRGEKVKSIRYKPKSGYTKTHGHKQDYTVLKIEKISA
jgi:large subunit ribosomal protein L21